MAFNDEIIKAQRNRSAFLDFSAALNPLAAIWPGAQQRLFGRFPDARGPVPIEGTVESFGTFTRAVANADFAPETPTLTVVLFDPDHYWRERAQRPSTDLKYRWIALSLRVMDDAAGVHDRRLALGQIITPGFGSGKRVSLDTRLSGGQWLGELIPRRTVTLTDFPRAAPENVGKAVPIVFGVFSNEVASADGDVFSSAGCAPKQTILIQESWANGNGSAFATGIAWEADLGPNTGNDPIDPLYPTLGAAEAVAVYTDLYGYGVNALWVHPSWNPAPPDDDWVIAGVAFRLLGPLPDLYNGLGTRYRLFDGASMWAQFTYYPDQYPAAEWFLYSPLYTTWDDYGYGYGLQVTAVDFYIDANGAFQDSDPDAYIEVLYTVWEANAPGYGGDYGSVEVEAYFKWGSVTAADLIDTKQTFIVCHQCGTYVYDPGIADARVASDGYIKIYINGTLVFARENIALVLRDGDYNNAGKDNSNMQQTVSFGWYGLVGPLTNILVTAGVEEVVTPRCGDDPGASENMASGALRALLVDTGTVPGVSGNGIATPITQDTGLPTVTGHEAHNIFDGGTINVAVFFYVAARKTDGTIGPISVIADLDNAYDPDQQEHAASLSWVAGGSATGYVVWMTTDANFHPVDSPELGTTRTKTITAESGSSFPPISGPAFDYQVIFTSLTDGDAFGGSTSDHRYLLAGHWLQSVDQVYVLKPVPTVTEDAEINTLTANVAAGASTIVVVFNDDAVRFREGQVVILAGDAAPYEITSSSSGTLGITPPARLDFTIGTTVAAATDVDTQVLMTEGTDYVQEVIEINGNRYHTLVFTERQQNPDTCQLYEVTANVRGSEIASDGSGVLISDGVSIVQHFFKNWIFNDYHSSVGPYAPSGNKWFEDVPYAPGLIDNASFYAANLVSSGRVDGNYQGGGALTEQISAQQLIHELITSFDLDLYYDDGAWHVEMFATDTVVRASLPSYAPTDDIVRDSFSIEFDQLPHSTVVPYFAGPMTGQVVGVSSDLTGGYVVAGQVSDPTAVALFGQQMTEPLYLRWTRHAPTAYDVAYRRLRYRRYPSIHARLTAPIGAITDALATTVKVTHPDGLGATGWTDRVCRVMRADIDLDEMVVHLLLHDVDDLVP